jgi:hypothetical protein
MIWPVDASVSQEYGSNPTADLPADSWLIRTFGNYQPNGHTGIDLPVVEGTPVRAVANGVVKHVGWYSGSYADNPYWIAPSFAGFVLVIDHGGFIGIYAHLSGSPVAVGETVREGQTVAYSGNTGGSTGPHLHFEVLPDGWDFNNGMYGRVNPAQYFSAAAIAPQSSTTIPEEPFTMGQYEELNEKLAKIEKTTYNTWAGVWDGGSYEGKKYNYGILPIVVESQRRQNVDAAQIKNLVSALAAVAKGEKFDEAKLLAGVQAAAEAGVKAGIADGTVTVDVQVNGAAA